MAYWKRAKSWVSPSFPTSPPKSGLLTGKYHLGEQAPEGSRLGGKEGSRFENTGNELLTVENLAFAYLLAHKSVGSVIVGATRPAQIVGNVRAAQWLLTEEEVVEVEGLLS